MNTKQSIGEQYIANFLEWQNSILSNNLLEFNDYFQPLNGKLNITKISKNTGIPTQSFKDNKHLADAYSALLEKLYAMPELPLFAPKSDEQKANTKVVKESFSSNEQRMMKQRLSSLEATCEQQRREIAALKSELAKLGSLKDAMFDVTGRGGY